MKLREFQYYLKEKNLDAAFLVHPDINITYFTQYLPSFAFLLITPKKAELYLTSLDKKPQLSHITTKIMTKHWKKAVANTHYRRFGINKESLTIAYFTQLKKLWPKARFVDVSHQLEELRRRKTTLEIEKIQRACSITSRAMAELLRELPKRNLKTEQDVAFFLEKNIRDQGAELAFPTIAALGRNAAVPHHKTSTAPLKRGFLVLDFGAKYQYYCADMTRTIFIGTPTLQEKKLYQLLLRSQQEAIQSLAKGIPFQQLDAQVRQRLGKYSHYFTHSLGHGIGVEVHEGPRFSDQRQKIQPQEVFTIEPGIYLPGKLGIRIEDTVVFTNKTKILTTFPKELLCVKL